MRVLDENTGKLLNTITNTNLDEPAWLMFEGTEQDLTFSVSKVGFDRILLEVEGGYTLKRTDYAFTTSFQFDSTLFARDALSERLNVNIRSENTETALKSFTIRPVRRPILFIDLNRDQGRKFTSEPYRFREAPTNEITKCESFLIGETISKINDLIIKQFK